jgi:hypothetical protein
MTAMIYPPLLKLSLRPRRNRLQQSGRCTTSDGAIFSDTLQSLRVFGSLSRDSARLGPHEGD